MVIINNVEKIDTLLKEAIAVSNGSKILLEILFVHERPLFALPDYFRHDNANTLHKEHVKEKIEEELSFSGYDSAYVIFVEESDTVYIAAALEKDNPGTLSVSLFSMRTLTTLPLDTSPSFDIDAEIIRGEKQKFEALKEKTGLHGEFIDELDEDLTDYIASHPSDLVVLHSENDNFLNDETISCSLISSVQKDLFLI